MDKYTKVGCLRLASAIVKQAINDAIKIDNAITSDGKWDYREKIRLELFFGSVWFDLLTLGRADETRKRLEKQLKNNWFLTRQDKNEFYCYQQQNHTGEVVGINNGVRIVFDNLSDAVKKTGITWIPTIIDTKYTCKGWKFERRKNESNNRNTDCNNTVSANDNNRDSKYKKNV